MHYTKCFLEESLLLKQRLAYSGSNVLYHGYAQPGTAEDEASWMIVTYIYDSSSNMTESNFADGSIAFDKIWKERASYEYS